MGRARARSNIYSLLPILACLIMGGGIAATWLRIEKYRGPEPPATYRAKNVVPQYVKPEQPKEEVVPEQPKVPGVEEAPAPAEGEGPVAPAAPGEGAAPAPAEGGVKPATAQEGAAPPAPAEEKPKENEKEEER